MAGAQNQQLGQLGQFLQRLSFGQRVTLVVATVAAIAAVIGLVSVVNSPSYATLFSGVDAQDAGKIVEKLKERKVQYALEDGGKTILVPRDQVYELRLTLAGEGLPQSSSVGYEIFDRTNLGVSDFVQKVNYRRALEGELARTIVQLNEVEGARVHIVVPQKALFKEDEKPATASVTLKLRSGRPLRAETVQAITHLVSSSVEGLEPSKVVLVDSRGMLLSEPGRTNTLAALTSTQHDLQQKVENHLAQKAQKLLDGVLGMGNAVVQVNVELDFRQVERTLEQYDAENPVVRSEQVTEEKTMTKDSEKPSTRTNTVTNYEINRTIERIVESVGGIKHLSVAAMINGTHRTVERGGEKVAEYIPRTQEEMDRITDIVKKAVGFSVERNDEVSVVNLPFGPNDEAQEFVVEEDIPLDWFDLGQKLFLVVAMISAMLIVRSLLSRLRIEVATHGSSVLGDPALADLVAKRPPIHLPSPEDEIAPEVLLRTERRKRIADYIEEKPEEASKLIKVWLAQE